MALRATPEDERVALDCRMVASENRMYEEKWPIKKWWKPPRKESGLADDERTSDWCYQARETK